MTSTLTLTLTVALLASSCAVTSSVTVPPCTDRLEIGGQHERHGRTLTFDHAFDPPLSKTEVTLRGRDRTEIVDIDNNQPDGPRLLVGVVFGLVGGALVAGAGYEMLAHDASFFDERPFYASIIGGGALVTGALLSLTGWHPRTPADLSALCREPDDP